MCRLNLLYPFALAFLAISANAQVRTLTPVWIEIGDAGAVARVVVEAGSACPSILVDGSSSAMTVRMPVPEGLKPVCQASIPTAARAASVEGRPLVLPPAELRSVVVIGDTGCRVKGTRVQNCKDSALWPFKQVATVAADAKPGVVIHVGDYVYREDPCPAESAALCGGSPSGVSWDSWNADFFAPAAKLLSAAPWVFARGNHESCERAWLGWFYYLDPRPFPKTCPASADPYVVKVGGQQLVVFDSAPSTDKDPVPETVELFAHQLAALHATNAWFVDHHPVWGLKIAAANPTGPPDTTPTELTLAWEKAPPKGIDLILSGHTHLFELLSFDQNRPTQLVAGNAGTEMAVALPEKIAGLKVRGATLLAGQDAHEFGFTALTKDSKGWKLSLMNLSGREIRTADLNFGH